MADEKPEWWSSDHWSTPPAFVADLARDFGGFDLDPCCREETAKAPNFFTEANDGLRKDWYGRVFLNPPYSKPAPWLRKAIAETECARAELVVALLPVRTDTRWFHSFVNGVAELRFIKGRIKWIGWQGTPIPNPKDPSMLAIYRKPPDPEIMDFASDLLKWRDQE
jgi:phage N-6-adenine-methyltransferase